MMFVTIARLVLREEITLEKILLHIIIYKSEKYDVWGVAEHHHGCMQIYGGNRK